MTVTPIRRDTARLEAAIRRHPSSKTTAAPTATPHVRQPGLALEALLRGWDLVVSDLSVGPDMLPTDDAEELVQVLASTLVHPEYDSRQLALTLPQIRAAIAQYDALRDGDITPYDVGCDTRGAALDRAELEVAALIYPLIRNRPWTDACAQCRKVRTVDHWAVAGECDDHDLRVI
jgi:hypothetical protein